MERSSEREGEGGGKGRVPTKMGGEGREEESWSGRESGSREKESWNGEDGSGLERRGRRWETMMRRGGGEREGMRETERKV